MKTISEIKDFAQDLHNEAQGAMNAYSSNLVLGGLADFNEEELIAALDNAANALFEVVRKIEGVAKDADGC